MLRSMLLVGLGGFLGSAARYGVYLVMNKYPAKSFPVATLTVNLVGCFIIGLLAGFASRSNMNAWWMLVLGTGFCGGFTTFSAFALDNNNLFRNHLSLSALGYIIFSVVMGILLCRLGMEITGVNR